MLIKQQQVEDRKVKQTKKLEGSNAILKKLQKSEKEEEDDELNIFCRQKEDQQTNNSKLQLLNNTILNQNKIFIALAKDSEQSQNMLFGCRGQNQNQNLNRNRNRNRNRKRSQTNNNISKEITLKGLVKKGFEKPKQYWFTIGTILLLALLICFQQATTPVEAKIHHSKRQAPDQSSFSSSQASPSLTGRENTNWWNLWWQRKYADPIFSSLLI